MVRTTHVQNLPILRSGMPWSLLDGRTHFSSIPSIRVRVAWRELTSPARRRFISSREPLLLLPFVSASGKQLSTKEPIFQSGPTFPQSFGFGKEQGRGERRPALDFRPGPTFPQSLCFE